VRNALGLSTHFTITEDPSGLRLYGRGWGHGLGMSQWGAYNLAKQGSTGILAHYEALASLFKCSRGNLKALLFYSSRSFALNLRQLTYLYAQSQPAIVR